MTIHIRHWGSSPLFGIGKWTLFFYTGIAFGVKHGASSVTYYIGPMIMYKTVKTNGRFVELVSTNKWPKNRIWTIKYPK